MTDSLETCDIIDRVAQVIIDSIIDAGGTIDFRVQHVARAAIEAMRLPLCIAIDDERVEVDTPSYDRAFNNGIGHAVAAVNDLINATAYPKPKSSPDKPQS